MLHAPPTRPRLNAAIPFMGMLLVGSLPLPLKHFYYRLRGARIGRNVRLGLFSYIASPEIILADDVRIAPFTFIRTRTSCILGARSAVNAFTAIDTGALRMGEDSTIGEQVAIGGLLTPRSSLTIGSRTKIFSYSFINPTEPVTIGDEVCIGGGNYIFTHGSWQSMLDGFPASFGPVHIQSGAWLAWRVFVMPNVTVGEQATVGAGSVVTRSIPARTLAVGAPARTKATGSEYIREVSVPERQALVLQWLAEYAELLTYTGQPARFTPSEEGATLHIGGAGKDVVIAYHTDALEKIGGYVHAVLSFAPISESVRLACRMGGTGWFDIAARECGFISSRHCKELRTYLTRYGLHFAVVG